MNKKDFEKKYRERIRVIIDWKRFAGSEWTVEQTQLALPRDVRKVWTPWLTPADRTGTHSLGAALSLTEVAEDPTLIGEEQATLFDHADELAHGVAIDAPAFALAGGRYLLLDRNHRIAAATILRRTAILELAVIVGPDLTLLPDLAEHLKVD